MTQEQKPEAQTSPPKAALLRFSAVLTASGPVILTAFGIGRQTFAWFCAPLLLVEDLYPAEESEDPYSLASPYGLGLYAPDDLPTELLFWGVLLLPIIVAGLVMNGSRRATLTAVATIATLLAYGLVVAFLSPGPDPWTSRPHAVTPPWLLITCYPLSAAALLLFVLVGIASYAGRDTDVLELLLTQSAPWRLLLAAALVASAAWHPRPRFSWTGTVHVTRSLLRGQLENVIPTRTRNALIALLIAAGALWLIVSSYTSTR
ncbi:hypothetical protein B0I32_103311 [Nonomuraea fuscirosea]|uniref:Uncharacterized protein n=1 Tax=Nonomuraea fuscirosea TaxID=1291556 RepID=A0A2T0N752_9ACTN|nr:hypothetical protein [Nonomuraea fuscirosea]PRX68350.1 hypothetical protein B0I32_103311 [Nonomuraea fuscirosea]